MKQFPLDTEGRKKDRIADAPPSVRARYQGLLEEGDEIGAARQMRVGKIARLGEEIESDSLQIHQAERQVKELGDYYSEKTDFDANGGQVTTRQKTGYVEKLTARRDEKVKERRALSEMKTPRKAVSAVDDALGGSVIHLVPHDGAVDWSPREGEQFADAYKREVKELNLKRDLLNSAWNAPLTIAEVIASVEAEIDALASEAPDFGGHRRGSSVGDRGVQIGNPNKQIGFVETRVGDASAVVDVKKLVGWAFKDQLKVECRAHIEATYSDEGAISAADKAKLIPKLEGELWQQRRVVEAAFLACRAAGIRNLSRPKDTPVEILLDVLPFKIANRLRAAAKRTVPAQEPEFEGTDNE